MSNGIEVQQSQFPDVETMTSQDRTEAILALRRKRVNSGEALSDDETTFAVRLLRAERTIVAKKRNKSAPDAGPALSLSDF